MKIITFLMHWGAQLVIERPVRELTLQNLFTQLDESRKQMDEKLASCSDTSSNKRQLTHIIGIERWGQRRLRVALGEPFLSEEYDHYRPSNERTWDELKTEWENTRQVTLKLVNQLIQANLPDGIKVAHNQYGPLSIKAWLRYLDVHASSEGKRIK
jgi:hypothetical protein